MSAALIAQLLIQFGPAAFDLIIKLSELWTKEKLSLEEVQSICDVARKSYDDYVK